MRIAVLMSTYNGHKYLSEQLESIANQTLEKDIKVYIRDDGSQDDTVEIIEKWKEKLSIFLIKGENVGPARSFWELLTNKDIEADYYLFCDQDDIWNEDKIEKSIEPLIDDVYLSFCNFSTVNSAGKILNAVEVLHEPVINIQRLFIAGAGQGCAMAFRKELRDYLIDIPLKNIPMHDIVLMLYALSLGKVVWIPEPLFRYRLHSNNVIAKKNKNFIKKVMSKYWIWKNGSKNSMADVARELLQYGRNFSDADRVFLKEMSDYKKVLRSKIHILCNCNCKYVSNRAAQSYRIRALMNAL